MGLISREDFVKEINGMSVALLRKDYGTTGNDAKDQALANTLTFLSFGGVLDKKEAVHKAKMKEFFRELEALKDANNDRL